MGLSFGQRVRAAARAAVGIFSDDSARQAFGLLGGLWPSTVGEPPSKGARERVAAYADMPWVFALADKIASAGAAVPWTLNAVRKRGAERASRMKALQEGDFRTRRRIYRELKAAGELVPVADHPFLDMMESGNSLITGIALRKLIFLYWDLEGEVFLLKDRGLLGTPRSIWPIPPDWVRLTPTPTNQNYMVSFRGWQGWIPETEFTWMQNHNPSNPYARGTGIVRALADEIETDEYAARSVRMTFINTARPDFIVFPKGENASINESERLRLQTDWEQQHQGFWRAFRARFASREMGVYEFQATDFRRLQMTQLREFERDLIRQVFGVPPEIMGIVQPGASRATIDRSSYLFSRWVLLPRLELIRAILQQRLVPEFDERLVLDYVSPVEEDKDFALDAAKAAPWSRSVDEWREMQDLNPMDGNKGKLFAIPSNIAIRQFDEAPATGPTPPGDHARPGEPGGSTHQDEEQARRGLQRLTTAELYELRRLRAKMGGAVEAPASLTDPGVGGGLAKLADAIATAARPRRRTIERDEDGLVRSIEED